MGSIAVPRNEPALNAPYFTPIQSPPAGTALSPDPPTLSTPLKIRDVTFQNRICMSSSSPCSMAPNTPSSFLSTYPTITPLTNIL